MITKKNVRALSCAFRLTALVLFVVFLLVK